MNTFQKCLLAVGASLLSLAPSALADSTASMVLTGAGSNVLDNVYIGPYTATINGVSTPVICDDYTDDSYIPEAWTANISSLSNLANTNHPGQTTDYKEIAYLTNELLAAPTNSLQAGEIQYALWAVFAPQAITDLTAYNSADGAAAAGYLGDAVTNAGTVDLSQYTLYTPIVTDPITCSGYANNQCPSTPPQEFIVRTPEPGALLLLSIGLGGLLLFARRRQSSFQS